MRVGSPHELKPGATILIRPDVGLLDRHGHWEKAADDLVQDVSVLEAGLPVALEQIYGRSPKEALEIVETISNARDDGDVTNLCRRLCATLRSKPPPWTQDGEWADFVAGLEVGLNERISTGNRRWWSLATRFRTCRYPAYATNYTVVCCEPRCDTKRHRTSQPATKRQLHSCSSYTLAAQSSPPCGVR